MHPAFYQNLTLLIIGVIVPLWCAGISVFATAKADASKASALLAVTIAFGETLAFFGVRLRRNGRSGLSPFSASFAGRDQAVGGE